MDWDLIISLIGSLGFPIVACVALFMSNKDATKQHKEEIDELRKSIDNNTIVIQKLVDKMENQK